MRHSDQTSLLADLLDETTALLASRCPATGRRLAEPHLAGVQRCTLPDGHDGPHRWSWQVEDAR